ncbi:mandelate racemase/muconate lactonizing enzyme family protein [Methylobacterium sp. J-070]|uniref:mandelate racemase/muconate lactonizing enzyme family protein n=1 Tax=Methylobacterium sp. J-070 TaxID=2836650 RepID=UPI001FBA55BD|nr:mandelate racemase/muconate lactonizing enzyme family protein [Methylobacterium sp. J-070]MCJ2049976.1 mandelate racemase/muconate lactonizing enzyme family protein [Methylobacterium sp. J-070]
MKIIGVTPLFVDRFLFVRITTDKGISGVGESGAWGHLEASAAAVRKFGEYLIGKDPRRIEHHWNVMHRFQNFTGAAISGAISAIDVALWDIKGKQLGVPIYELLGGAMRDTVRLYGHCKGRTVDGLVARARDLVAKGFSAVGYMNPLLEEGVKDPWYKSYVAKIDDAVEAVRLVREAVGPKIDLCVELHTRMKPGEAIAFGRAIEHLRPMYIEDPIPPYNLDAMAHVAAHLPVPIATGERFIHIHQFQMLLARRGAEYLRPCISVCGGITAGRKIAALAEAHNVDIVYHNPLSPINLAACLHLDAAIPNFAIQEYPLDTIEFDGLDALRGSQIVTGLAAPEGGFLSVPDGAGLGLDLPEDAPDRFPARQKPVAMRSHLDGSVVEE